MKDKYLVVIGLYGPGNQYLAIEQAIQLSKYLGRKLVEPVVCHHFSTSNPKYRLIEPLSKYFQINYSMVQPVILESCIKPTYKYAHPQEKTYVEFYSKQSEDYYRFTIEKLPIRVIKSSKLSEDSTEIVVIAMEYLTFSSKIKEKITFSLWSFREEVLFQANLFVSHYFNSEKFISINLRRVCDFEKETFEEFFGLSPTKIFDWIDKLKTEYEVKHVFLSIKPSLLLAPDLQLVIKQREVITLTTFFDNSFSPHHLSVIEQAINFLSEIFLYSYQSSYSYFVYKLRCNLRKEKVNMNLKNQFRELKIV